MTIREVTDYIIAEIAKTYDVRKSVARQLLIDALDSTVVQEEIISQVDYLVTGNV